MTTVSNDAQYHAFNARGADVFRRFVRLAGKDIFHDENDVFHELSVEIVDDHLT